MAILKLGLSSISTCTLYIIFVYTFFFLYMKMSKCFSCTWTISDYPPQGMLLEITRGAKILMQEFEAKLQLPEGWGSSNQKHFYGGKVVWKCCGTTHPPTTVLEKGHVDVANK